MFAFTAMCSVVIAAVLWSRAVTSPERLVWKLYTLNKMSVLHISETLKMQRSEVRNILHLYNTPIDNGRRIQRKARQWNRS